MTTDEKDILAAKRALAITIGIVLVVAIVGGGLFAAFWFFGPLAFLGIFVLLALFGLWSNIYEHERKKL